MSDYIAIYTAIVLTGLFGQIASELSKIRKVLELRNGLDKADSDKEAVEVRE